MIDPAILVKDYSDLAFNLALKLVGNKDDAYDIVQDAFVSIINKLDKIENPKAYLLKAVYNYSLNHLKRSKRMVAQTTNSSIAFVQQPELDLEKANHQLREKLELLSDKQREVITYRFWSDMKLVEIAKLLKINEATVRVHLARGLNKLKNIFKNSGE